MNDPIAVYVLQSKYRLSEVHPGQVHGETADVLEQCGHVTALHELHHHVQVTLEVGKKEERS